jgi:hypothetical protein
VDIGGDVSVDDMQLLNLVRQAIEQQSDDA